MGSILYYNLMIKIECECKVEYNLQNLQNLQNSENSENSEYIKLNEELFDPFTVTMDYYTLYVKNEMAKGLTEFHASVKFLMDENVHQKYKDIYRKKQNQVIEAMDLDEYPEPPKLKRDIYCNIINK